MGCGQSIPGKPAIENGREGDNTNKGNYGKQTPQHMGSSDQCLGRRVQPNDSSILGIDHERIAPKDKKIEDFYEGVHDESRELGRSAIGIVRRVTHKSTGIDYAVKIVQVEKIPEDEMQHIRNEVLILCDVDHPNVIRLQEVFETKKLIYIVQELCEGGDLAGLLTDKAYALNRVLDPDLWERRCAEYTKQMLSGLQYLHSKGIIHRDLKLENVLFKSKGPDSELKIIDFDLSTHFQPGQRHQESVGTLYTAAPELLKRDYDERCDIWSIGVMVYVLLSGTAPFGGCYGEKEKAPIIKNILQGYYDLQSPTLWANVSPEAKSFIRKLLVKSKNKRATITEAQKLPWLQKDSGKSRAPSPTSVSSFPTL